MSHDRHPPTQVTPWIDGYTIPRMLQRTAERYPENDALVFVHLGVRMNFRTFATEVDRAAQGLAALGIQAGEHVAIWATNLPEWIILQFATARIGAVLVTVNPAYRATELQYVLNQSDAVALFLSRQFKSNDFFEMLGEVCPELATSNGKPVRSQNFPKLGNVVAIESPPPLGALTWQEMLTLGDAAPVDLDAISARLKPNDPINIQYTSGTTGFPKAATLSHRNLLMNVFYVGECLNLTAGDRICIPVPFYHCFGCVLGILCATVHGAAMIIPDDSFHSEATLRAIDVEKATVLYGVPTMFISQLQHPNFAKYNLSSLRTGIMAGSPCPIEVMKQVVEQMHCREITIGYGQTEASPIITQTRTTDPIELRVETVGRPLPGVEVKIIDPTTGEELGDNVSGELCARGHNVMLGYYNNPDATAAAIDASGLLHTGDLALRLPNGCFKITGRIKDLVIRGGENIYPREIEEYLFTHPAIEQASVVGLPDVKYGEELCAWIKLKAGQICDDESVRTFCRENLAHFKGRCQLSIAMGSATVAGDQLTG
jgi:fatty-acyl-CoA synthase